MFTGENLVETSEAGEKATGLQLNIGTPPESSGALKS
jgi:hypothetical protein